MSTKYKVLSFVFFGLSIASVYWAIVLIIALSQLQEIKDFPSYFVEHSWIMFFFLVIPIVSFIFWIIAKKKGKSFYRNLITSLSAILLIGILGCFCFFKLNISHYYPYVHTVDQWFYVTPMPTQGKITTRTSGNTTISIAYIPVGIDKGQERDLYEQRLKDSLKYTEDIDYPIVTSNFQYMAFSGARKYLYKYWYYNWYILVDSSTGEYHPKEEIKGHQYYFAAYSFADHQMVIVEFIGK